MTAFHESKAGKPARRLNFIVRYHVVGEVSEVVQVSVRKDILNLITETEP